MFFNYNVGASKELKYHTAIHFAGTLSGLNEMVS